jgi:hypothetical protein
MIYRIFLEILLWNLISGGENLLFLFCYFKDLSDTKKMEEKHNRKKLEGRGIES